MQRTGEGFQRGRVATISAVHFIHDCYTAFLAPALPLIIEKLGISYGMTGLLAVIQRIPSLFNPLIGIIAERPVVVYGVFVHTAARKSGKPQHGEAGSHGPTEGAAKEVGVAHGDLS